MPAVAFHCQAKVVSRTKGQSAVACAAYRARAVLEDERYGKVQDFSRIKGLEFVWHAAPADAPAWAKDVGQTWNAVERVEVRRNSTLAREYVAAFPHQLSAEQREWMLKDFVREEFTRKGLITTAVIHAPDKGDERNFHTHVMVAERPVDAEGWSKHKDRSLQSKETLAEVREKWAELGARQLERAGFEIEAERWRHGHKSLKQQEAAALERGDLAYAEQVRDREPTTHVGHVAMAIERKGRVSERGELNREVEARNVERKEIEVDLAAVRQELERLVLEPDDERVEVDSSPGVGEPRRSNERHSGAAEEGLRDVGDAGKADCIRLYRGIGNNVQGLDGQPFDGVFFSTNIERAREFGEVHFVDVTPEELARYKCPHSKHVLHHEPIAKDDYRIDDPDILSRLLLLSPEKEREEVSQIAPLEPVPAVVNPWKEKQAAAAIRESWQGAERDPVSFAIGLGEQGLTLAENEKGRFVAVDERGAVHPLSGAALGEKPWEVQRELALAFKAEGSVQLPGVAEVRQELREARDAERAESVLGWAAHRRAEARERAAQWEENRAIWKEQRQLDRQIDRVEAAQERPQGAVLQAIGRAYAESSSGAELVEELEQRGFMVCRVSAEEAERSQRQRAVLGTTPSYQEGEVLAMTERGHAYRINAETIAMTATNTYDHVQNVSERLASIEPQDVLSLSQAQEVVTQKANERGSMPLDRFEQLPSAWEIGRGAEAAVDAAEGVASKGAEVVIAFGEGVANFFEGSLFGGASRKAPGGAEYVPPAAAGPPPPLAVTKPPWLEKQEKLRTTSGVEATEDPAVKGKVEEKQGQSFNEQFEELRRRNAKAAQERAELYRDRDDDGDRDRDR